MTEPLTPSPPVTHPTPTGVSPGEPERAQAVPEIERVVEPEPTVAVPPLPQSTPSDQARPVEPAPRAQASAVEPSRLPPSRTLPTYDEPVREPPTGTGTGTGRSPLAVLSAIGFVLLLAGLVYLYERQQAVMAAQAAFDPGQLAALNADQQSLGRRLATLEQRPAPTPTDLGPLTMRLDGVDAAIKALPPPPDLAPLSKRLDDLTAEVKAFPPPADLAPLGKRIDDLQAQVKAIPPPPDVAAATGPLAAKLDALTADQQKTAQADQAADKATADRVAALEQRLDAAETAAKAADQRAAQTSEALAKVTAAATQAGVAAARASRLQQAQAALDAGQPVGAIPGAPPALARFAQEKPPTEAALRLAYPAAAEQAASASRPAAQNLGLPDRMWLRASSLLTIRDGDKVVLGAPASAVLTDARAKLEAGDLAGAVAILDKLDGPAADAMAEWRDDAKALLAARAALAGMAHS